MKLVKLLLYFLPLEYEYVNLAGAEPIVLNVMRERR